MAGSSAASPAAGSPCASYARATARAPAPHPTGLVRSIRSHHGISPHRTQRYTATASSPPRPPRESGSPAAPAARSRTRRSAPAAACSAAGNRSPNDTPCARTDPAGAPLRRPDRNSLETKFRRHRITRHAVQLQPLEDPIADLADAAVVVEPRIDHLDEARVRLVLHAQVARQRHGRAAQQM